MTHSTVSSFTVKRTISVKNNIGALFYLVLVCLLCIVGCHKEAPTDTTNNTGTSQYQFETTGEEFLVSALDEVESIADFAQQTPGVTTAGLDLNALGASLPSKDRKQIISSSETDSTYIYGEVTSDGYGAVVTERHAYPKGLLLITVRKSYGKPATKIVTETKRFITYQDFLSGTPQQSNITELYGLTNDTLITHVARNGTIEIYTFRLPVITSVTNPVNGSVRVTTRYGAAGTVRSEIRDGGGALIRFRETYGDSTGALTTYTQNANASWRKVRTIGQSDGSVKHEITTGP